MKGRYWGIQGLRGILFMIIFLFHCRLACASMGWMGVQIFLVLTSFLLTEKLMNMDSNKIFFLKLLKHRFIRLYPIYILLIISASSAFIVLNNEFPNDILYYCFYVQNFFWIATKYSSDLIPATAHTWYLTIDIFLFMAWVVILKYCRGGVCMYVCMYVCIGLSVIYRCASVIFSDNVYLTSLNPICYMDSFALGTLLALYKENGGKIFKITSVVFSLIGICGILVSIYVTSHVNTCGYFDGYLMYSSGENYLKNVFTANIFLWASFLAYGIIALFITARISNYFSRLGFILLIGDMSYSLYIVHWPVLKVLKYFCHNVYTLIVLGLILTIIITFIWHKLIEPKIMLVLNPIRK